MNTHYDGKNLYISLNGVVMNAYPLYMSVTERATTVISSAGNPLIINIAEGISTQFTIEYLETPESPCAELIHELVRGRSVTLLYAPKGVAGGYPYYSCITNVIDVERSSSDEYTERVSAILLRDGDWIHHYEKFGSIL